MIFIAVKFAILPAVADQWLTRVTPFTAATRAEPGNLVFAWSRSAASAAHVHSAHFHAARAWIPDVGAATLEIIHVDVPGDGWSPMAELQPRTTP